MNENGQANNIDFFFLKDGKPLKFDNKVDENNTNFMQTAKQFNVKTN